VDVNGQSQWWTLRLTTKNDARSRIAAKVRSLLIDQGFVIVRAHLSKLNRENPIGSHRIPSLAHDLVDGPLVTMDRLHHPFEDRIQDLAGIFWVAVGGLGVGCAAL
jgi:hypothetical protein